MFTLMITCVHVCVCVHIYIYIYTCIHTYIYAIMNTTMLLGNDIDFVHSRVNFRHNKSLPGCHHKGCINVYGCKH